MTRAACGLMLVAGAGLLCGCSERQSALAPRGPGAAQIAQLSWVLFATGTVILLAVLVILWLAIYGSAPTRARLARPGAVVVGGIALPAVVLTGLLGYGIWLTRGSVLAPGGVDPVRIEVVGEQWWWRVAYLTSDHGRVSSANEIRIPVGRPVEFVLSSADVIHSFWVPNLGGKVDMIPGRVTSLRVIADRAGVFRGQCAEYCGGPHALMALEVVAMPAREVEAWLAAQSTPRAAPTTATDQRGERLLLSAGCGACHTVRGTEAAGTIGPDLTHIGSRRSVGLDTLPLTAANIALFITDGQHLKPGNHMPPFRVLAEDDLKAVASYLASLK
jgi:cytochrome c oxidase subunit 2